MRLGFSAIAVVVYLATPLYAGAQTFVGAGVGASVQTEGRRDCPYLCGPLGGSGIGATITAGRWITPRIGGGVEVSLGGALQGTQTQRVFGGTFDFVTD